MSTEQPPTPAVAPPKLYCANHPTVETVLRCSKCLKPICPTCTVPTEFGGRCRECTSQKLNPLYQISLASYLRAIAVALGLGILGGILWSQLLFLWFLAPLIIGYAAGEGIAWAVRYRQGRGVTILATATVLMAYIVSRGPRLLTALALVSRGDPLTALVLLVDPLSLLIAGIAVIYAVNRTR